MDGRASVVTISDSPLLSLKAQSLSGPWPPQCGFWGFKPGSECFHSGHFKDGAIYLSIPGGCYFKCPSTWNFIQCHLQEQAFTEAQCMRIASFINYLVFTSELPSFTNEKVEGWDFRRLESKSTTCKCQNGKTDQGCHTQSWTSGPTLLSAHLCCS